MMKGTEDNGMGIEPPNYLKAFLSSAGAGAAFGLVASLVFLRILDSPWPPALFTAGVTLLAGLFSGVAGLGGAYLDVRLQRWGVKKAQPRAAISFGIVAILTFSIAYTGTTVFGDITLDSQLHRYTIWGASAGLVFGAVFALVSYRSEKIRQKMQLLEMENRHLSELASREELLREAARNLAVAEERNRMARELHDSISQGVHGIVYSLRSLRGVLQSDQRGLEILSHLEETAAGTLNELRHLVVELTPSPLEEHGLLEAIRLHCDLFARRQQVELELELEYSGGLQPDQEAALYRIVQEALANIQKHAGAGRVTVSLKSGSDTVLLTVRDNGRGFEPAAAAGRGHGLINMAARARRNDGTLQVLSSPGEGASVTAEFQK